MVYFENLVRQTVMASLILDVSVLGDVSKRLELCECWIIETCYLLFRQRLKVILRMPLVLGLM